MTSSTALFYALLSTDFLVRKFCGNSDDRRFKKIPAQEFRCNFGVFHSGIGAFTLKLDKICPVDIVFLLIASNSFCRVKKKIS